MTPDRIWAIVLAVFSCLVSAFVGILVDRLRRQIIKRDQKKDELDSARFRYDLIQIKLAMASLSLAEATAEAVQRIPDANCNGDMHAALEIAKKIKRECREFETEQTARSMTSKGA